MGDGDRAGTDAGPPDVDHPGGPSFGRSPTITSAVHVPPPGPAARRSDSISRPAEASYQDGDRAGGVADAENKLQEIAEDAKESEDRRELHFRSNEDERDRLFLDNEARRDQEASRLKDDIFHDLEERIDEKLAGIRPERDTTSFMGDRPVEYPTSIRPASVRPASMHESVYTAAQDAASRHAADIMETVRMEREELAREREAAQADRDRLEAERDAERARKDEECQEKISALEAELAKVREELEMERQQRLTEDAETREREKLESVERDEVVRNQLGDITNLVQDQRDECARKKDLMDERWSQKELRREEKDMKFMQLQDMVAQIVQDREAEKIRAEEERLANEGKPGQY